MRFTITLPPDRPLAPAGFFAQAQDRPALALSPDGSLLAYVALIGNQTQICVRDMERGTITVLDHTVGGHTPFFSPDGAWVGFFADAKLKKTPSTGGAVTVLAEAPSPFGATWGPDDAIYFNRYEGEGVFRVAGDGGPVRPVVPGEALMPERLPAGRLLVVTDGTLRAVDPADPSASRGIHAGGRALHAGSGHLVFQSGYALMAAPFDLTAMRTTGKPELLVENLRTANYSVAQFTLSENGMLVYVVGRPQHMASFVWVDREGRTEPLPGLAQDLYSAFALSPDGNRLALSFYPPRGELVIYDRQSHTTSRLTPRAASGVQARQRFPRWTPDGRFVLYLSTQPDMPPRLMAMRADGSGEPRELWRGTDGTGPAWLYPMGFSTDRSTLAVFGPGRHSSYDLYTMRAGVSAPYLPESLRLFHGTELGETLGQISPDGRWMLFASDRSGFYEIYATSFPQPGRVLQVSKNGGREPMWNPAAPEIVYLTGSEMYAIDVSRGLENAGEPRLLFRGAYPDSTGLGFDMSPDGRFLMLENKRILEPTHTLEVITNVAAELRRLASRAKP